MSSWQNRNSNFGKRLFWSLIDICLNWISVNSFERWGQESNKNSKCDIVKYRKTLASHLYQVSIFRELSIFISSIIIMNPFIISYSEKEKEKIYYVSVLKVILVNK